MIHKIIILTSILIHSCAMIPSQLQLNILNNKDNSNWKEIRIKTNSFILTSYQNISKPYETVRIYIEGDGRAWISKTRLAKNPTPKKPVGFLLAKQDPSANVVYLARPCQYTPLNIDNFCEEKYWSTARYAPLVVTAMNEAIDNIKESYNLTAIELIGFSGGGNIAAIIASIRDDVKNLRTVAGNLNFHLLDKHHATTPLTESLNAIDVVEKLQYKPQRHFVGTKDKIVPSFIAESFKSAMSYKKCSHIDKQPFNHHDWIKNWPKLLNKSVECK